MNVSRNGSRRLAAGVVACLAGLALVGCSGAGPSGKALQAYQTTMAQDQGYQIFGIETAARSSATATEAFLIEGAQAKPYKVSQAALRGLVDRPVPGATEALTAAFEAKGGAQKQLAALALARSGDAGSQAWLVEQLSADPAGVTPDVLVYLAEMGDDDAVKPILADRVGNDDEPTRDQAYLTLGRIPKPWSAQLLLAGLKSEHGARRKEAISALGNVGDPAVVPEIKKFTNTQGLVFATIEALGKLGGDDAIASLQKAADTEEPLVRLYAGAGLWRAGDVETGKGIVDGYVADEDPTLRLNVAQQLAGIEDAAAREILLILAHDDDPTVRTEALRGLLHNGGPELEASLLDVLQVEDYQAVTIALECLGRYAGATALPSIEPILDSGNPYLVIASANAILEIDERSGGSGG